MNDKTKAASAEKDTSAQVQAYAVSRITQPDDFGGRAQIPAGTVFVTTQNELDRLIRLKGARKATAAEIQAEKDRAAEAQDTAEDAAAQAEVGNYNKYKDEARTPHAEVKADKAAKTEGDAKTGKAK